MKATSAVSKELAYI